MSAATRQARYRRRQRAGRRTVLLEIDAGLVEDVLVAAGYLIASDADDPKKIQAALQTAVAEWVDQRLAATWARSVTRNDGLF